MTSSPPEPAPTRERLAWCLFDFANSAFTTVAITAFGSAYFVGVLAADGVDLGFARLGPAAAWGAAIAISMALVTLTSPFMGAVADRSKKKKALLGGYVALCVLATFGLSLVPPGAGLAAFALFVVANFAYEGAFVFYNAFLPELVPPERLGRLSGQGWALGYVGGLLSLALCLPLTPEQYVPAGAGAASRIFAIVAVWYFVFSLPALLWLRERHAVDAPASVGIVGHASAAFRELSATLRAVRRYRVVLLFLAAYFLYNDGVTTVIAFTGVYTKEVLAFTPGDNIKLFLVLNVIAAPGALFFGHVLDRVGGRKAIAWTLVVWMMVVAGAIASRDKATFFGVAALAAVVIGATQSSSRALMARLAPRRRMGEFMGLLSLSGKASAVVGPILYGAVAEATARPDVPGSGHRTAIGAIGVFFVIALFLLRFVDEDRGMREARETDGEDAESPIASSPEASI